MNQNLRPGAGTTIPQLFLTAPSPCPYLPGRMERKVFTQLAGAQADRLHTLLTHAGFRRSQSIAYRPACEGCTACLSVRVVAGAFSANRAFRRIARRNNDLHVAAVPADPTPEQFSLLRRYLDSRHGDGGMADMTALDYAAMVDETPIDTFIIEYRLGAEGPLAAAALTDRLQDGLSMVYSFFDPDLSARSLGTFMILDHIRRTNARGRKYVYLGYWVRDCTKMAYKARFQPLEALGPSGWRRLETD